MGLNIMNPDIISQRRNMIYPSLSQLKIFKKALDLASWASNDKDMTHGKILNVMSTDVNQFHFMFYFVNFILVAPLQVGSKSCVITEHSNVQ